jgi:hypothetical protein
MAVNARRRVHLHAELPDVALIFQRNTGTRPQRAAPLPPGIAHALGTARGLEGSMCRRVQCDSCGKPTYAGCGRHVEEVLRAVALEERCHCRSASHTAAHSRVLREAAANCARPS